MTRPTLFAVFLVAALASTATADPKSDAKVHVDRAKAAHEAGNFKVALKELTKAYELDPSPQLLFGIGQVHKKLGDCATAITYYEKFLDTEPKASQARVVREAITRCKGKLAAQQPASATKDDAKEDPKKVAKEDPKKVAKEDPKKVTKEDPKKVTKEDPKKVTKEDPKKVTKEDPQTEDPDEEPDEEPDPPEDEPAPAPAPTPPPAVVPAPVPAVTSKVDEPPARRPNLVGYGLVAAGSIATGVGVVLYTRALSQRDDADNAPTYDEFQNQLADARSARNLSYVVMGVGGAVLVGGVVQMIVVRKRSRLETVALVPTTGGAFATLGGSF